MGTLLVEVSPFFKSTSRDPLPPLASPARIRRNRRSITSWIYRGDILPAIE